MIKLNADIRFAIEDKAKHFSLDPDIVEAIVLTESSGRPDAWRYEPNFFAKYVRDNPNFEHCTGKEKEVLATSWGLMQVMGLVAWELGLKHNIRATLCTIDGGLWYGCMHFARFIKKYGNENDAIASYNAGSARMKDGQYVNADYVAKVMRYYREIKGENP